MPPGACLVGAMNTLELVTAADANFAKQLAVLLASIKNSCVDDPVRVTVMTDSIDVETRPLISGELDVRWVEVDSATLDGLNIPRYLPKTSLFRLLIPTLFESDVPRVIYLDADVLVRGSVAELMSMDLSGYSCAAVRDPSIPWAGAPQALPWRELGIAPDTPYFNTGVLVIDLERWRQTSLGPKALDVLTVHKLRYGDQCALNVVLQGGFLRLDPTWNLQAGHNPELESLGCVIEPLAQLEAAVMNPRIVHFNTSPFLHRPWQHGCSRRFTDEWFAALDETAFAGWRPQPPRERVPVSVPRRIVRKLRRLASQ